MHTRRIATFLLGIWIGCSLFMTFITIENPRSVSLVTTAPVETVAQMTKVLGPEQVRLLLRHHAFEQNRHYLFVWEQAQFLLGLGLAVFLYLGTQKRILPLLFCGLMLALVLVQYFEITPELAYRGRETDFPPGNAVVESVTRMWALNQLFAGTEILKLIAGGILASYLFAYRSSRKRVTGRDTARENSSERLSREATS